ncbi:bifunctional phosphopantothenoylcysteine decarboxylase/phosphopantothenate--cysteine ligase CoaBC [Gelria sp. Kuro-4]|uniref:bifunctional phosphopantothenoylcysteine decarboxylase/phosphopantothenate--cysteine ligase CoaBC n=1 Tax=Gelria sp. Kuro-4 TaxID=2796927 RepID=UPI001BF14F2C|nr:bifunctional phosphopantothenoylcysteine decarboxylase/phosphopantothenate--cysteine ligase CoaBC [Gelria sp. Kuro-4]BCV24741.1 phosphopantothenoylcysteine decarboxylase [Gelria sp. Kuro-4]
MAEKTVILGVTGGIAAYKAAEVASRLVQAGHTVKVIMTEAATRFVAPLTFQTLTGQPVVVDMFAAPPVWNVAHVAYAAAADLVLIAPATADVLAKLAHGLADDMLTTTVLATRAPVLVAPAMNSSMYLNPAVQQNLAILRGRGFHMVEPETGRLACGTSGPGRLAAPEAIVAAAEELLRPACDLAGWRVVVTAGPTREALDPVRFLSNRSSGKMGYALAQVAAARGAAVTLISGPTALAVPPGVERVEVTTAAEMCAAVLEHFSGATALVMAAAVADWRPKAFSPEKIKKGEHKSLLLELERTPDILAAVAPRKKPGQLVIGFAAESSRLTENAREKLLRKRLDFIVANDITRSDAGFASDANEVKILWPDGRVEELPRAAKEEVAAAIWNRAVAARKDMADAAPK